MEADLIKSALGLASQATPWGGLLKMLAGGAASFGGDLISKWITGDSGSKLESGETWGDAQKNAASILSTAAPGATLNSMYNQAGDVGQAVEASAKSHLEGLRNTAGAMGTASGMRADARKMASTIANRSMANDIVSAKKEGTNRSMIRDMMSTQPAAVGSKMARALGEANTEARLKAATENAGLITKAIGEGANIRAGAQEMLGKDKMLEFETGVKPYLASVNESLAANILGANQAGKVATDSVTTDKEGVGNLFGGLAAGLTQAGTTDIGINSALKGMIGNYVTGRSLLGLPDESANSIIKMLIEAMGGMKQGIESGK